MIGQDPAAVPEARFDNAEELSLQGQFNRGDLTGLRAYMRRTREQRDWQDRIFLLGRIVRNIPIPVLDFACEAEPEAVDLQVVRAAYFSHIACTTRASMTLDQGAAEGWTRTQRAIDNGIALLDRIAKLDNDDPTAFAMMMPAFMIFEETMPLMRRAFQHIMRIAPDLLHAHWAVVSASSQRWYGTHEGAVEMARKAMEHQTPGDDMAACLFWARLQILEHLERIDKDAEAAGNYVHDPDVRRELEAAFDHWVAPPYVPRRSSVAYLGWAGRWFYRARDRERVQRVLDLTRGDFAADGWVSKANYRRAELFAAGKLDPDQETDPFDQALEILAAMAPAIKAGKLSLVEASLQTILQLETQMSSAEAAEIKPLLLLHEGLLYRQRNNEPEEARRHLEEAVQLVESAPREPASMRYCELMARAFMRMADARHAIPYWEHALQLGSDTLDSVMQAEMMLWLGNCYLTSGLSEHAAIPLRAAVKIFRLAAGDPHLPDALMALATAVKQSHPDEAEALYRESADLYSSQMKLESATSPWLNLGVLCSQRGRHEEAAELYERVLRIREQARSTSAGSLATLLNNMASNYRRMKKLREAHATIDRAIEMLPPGDKVLASALGTRGMIYLDEGNDQDAVKCLQGAIEEFHRQASPNLVSMTDDLERLIGALTRLGRLQEAAAAQQELDELRARIRATPQSKVESSANAELAGALLIELSGINRLRKKSGRNEVETLVEKARELIRLRDVGYYRGKVSIPESTTLVFHSASPEALWSAIESCVMAEPIAAGARITIRDGATHREVVVPTPLASLN